ncbi:type II toxin-antitoxin system CcdA family antitoxin [Streptosporangium canum]|nr:type II toxin-antitoxin system CcdA family antitoxin [Streptosporangium canum]
MAAKDTITVTVDHDLVEHAKAQSARSLSAYVNEALAERVARDRRRRALLTAKAAQADDARVERMIAHVESQRDQ